MTDDELQPRDAGIGAGTRGVVNAVSSAVPSSPPAAQSDVNLGPGASYVNSGSDLPDAQIAQLRAVAAAQEAVAQGRASVSPSPLPALLLGGAIIWLIWKGKV